MPIKYKKLFELMEQKGINKAYLRKNGFHANTVDRLKKDQHVSTEIIERLCSLLGCQPSDIMEYVEDEEK